MHETTLVRNMVRRIVQVAEGAEAHEVRAVNVRLGAWSEFSPEHLREHFEHEARATVVEGARLNIMVSDDPTDPLAQEVLLESVEVE
jgi:hydrogenase nickel incorporation protein HypA/HybF